MAKFTLKRAPNPERLRVYVPDSLYGQLSKLATRANTTLDDVVCQCLFFAVKQLRLEEDQPSSRSSH